MELVKLLADQKLFVQPNWRHWESRGCDGYGIPLDEKRAQKYFEKLETNYKKVASAVSVFLDKAPYLFSSDVDCALNILNGDFECSDVDSEHDAKFSLILNGSGGHRSICTPLFGGSIGNPFLYDSDIDYCQFPEAIEEAIERNGSVFREIILGENRPASLPSTIKIHDGKYDSRVVNKWDVVMYKDRERMIQAVENDFLIKKRGLHGLPLTDRLSFNDN